MKIVLTGGGSGGHFYPLIAVADKVREISDDKKILQPKIIYMATEPYNEEILFRNEIDFMKIYAGKLRKNSFLKNIPDIFKTLWGILDTLVKMFQLYPDVIFTNGGYVAFPVLISARILRIPVIIHVSDTVPSRVLIYAGKFAKKVSIAFPEAEKYFDKEKVAHLGNPLRDEIKLKQKEGSRGFFNLDYSSPVIWILGGSQGSQIINDRIISALPKLVEKYQIIHQTGQKNYKELYGIAGVTLLNNPLKKRYKIFPYLDNLHMRMAAGAADLVVTRAGAGSLSEIANWNLPAIVIPLSEKVSRDQESNSFAYARTGAATVIRQKNLTPNILLFEIDRIFNKKEVREKMIEGTKSFFISNSEQKIAEAVLNIALEHEK